LFSVSVAFKGVRFAVSRLFATLAGKSISVADLEQIRDCARADAEVGHLLPAFRGFLCAGSALDFLLIERGGRTAVQTFADIPAEILHFQGAELILLL
jgi:hypothetical protein